MNFSTTLRLSPRIQQEERALKNAQARFSLATKETKETESRFLKFSYGEFSRMNNIFGEETAIDYARLNGVSTTQIELWLKKGLQ